jgi:hypothetical protein
MVEYASWHWIFWVNVPVGVVGFVAARRFMAGGDALAVRAFDAVGYGLLAFGMAAVSLAVEGMAGGGVRGASALVMLVFGLASLAAYWLHALRSGNPLFAPGLFTVRTLRVGLLGNLFSRLGSSCMPFMIPLVLQVSLGFAPLQAGLMMLPTVLGSMAVKPLVTCQQRQQPAVDGADARHGHGRGGGGRGAGEFRGLLQPGRDALGFPRHLRLHGRAHAGGHGAVPAAAAARAAAPAPTGAGGAELICYG